ncbi:Bax inhibitor-1/YccA family protein [Corynebacterium caspium]|uniref:Bax inhibitor-1/YccA family protein n=1 Tax=Corynebacterium caspium TaxID=234828 RepID=UPI000372F449|nr:Bax inhibitor-1/YccA family protein [Corynebacterium caspium]WKD59562.1 Bax inhibitor 1 like protein [Corynebacterium caspium DSM 44850]
MRSSNPVLTSLQSEEARRGKANGGAFDPYASAVYPTNTWEDTSAPSIDRPMTVDDVVTKTGITLAVIIAGALINFFIGAANPGLAMMLTLVGGLGGFITVLVSAFSKKFGSKAVTLTYAAFEGLFVGGISFLFAGISVSGANGGALIGQAVIGTVGVFIGMLYVYKTGAIKVTPKFTKLMTAGLVGVLVLSFGNLFLAMLTGNNPLRDGGMLAIIFSLVCIGLAAMSFLQDFDVADKLIRSGAPASHAWGVALGLAVTLVWLYTEILRLLSYFNRS